MSNVTLNQHILTLDGHFQGTSFVILGNRELQFDLDDQRLQVRLPKKGNFLRQRIKLTNNFQEDIQITFDAQGSYFSVINDYYVIVEVAEADIFVSVMPYEMVPSSPFKALFDQKSIAAFHQVDTLAFQNSNRADVLATFHETSVRIDFADIEPLSAQLIFKRQKSAQYVTISALPHADNEFDLTSFLDDALSNRRKSKWNWYALLEVVPGEKKVYRLYTQEDVPENKADRYLKIYDADQEDQIQMSRVAIYMDFKRQIMMQIDNRSAILTNRIDYQSQIDKLTINDRSLRLNIQVQANSDQFARARFALIQRNPDEFNIRFFKTKRYTFKDGYHHYQIAQDFSEWELFAQYWDIFVVVKDSDDRDTYLRVAMANSRVQYQIKHQPIKQQVHFGNDMMYPYLTKFGSLSFIYRKRETFETKINYFKEWLAYWYVVMFGQRLVRKNIWIGYEKMAQSAHDSGYHFFNYVYQNQLYPEYYYVIDPASPEYHFLADKTDKVLKFMSFKYFVYLFAARTLLSSDTRRNVYNLLQRETLMGKAIATKKLVYLQHGVNGIKRVKDFYKSAGQFDLVIAPDEWERQNIAIKEWGFKPDEVVAAGLPRWDAMVDKTSEIDFRQIFVMPTWRNWMAGMPDEKFVQSEFYQEYQRFLTSPVLKTLLIQNNIRIAFFMHPKFKDYIHLFTIDEEIIDSYEFLEVPLDDMIMKSSLMISDYSSVQWEMYYLKKPVIFYQFDQQKYLEYEGSSMDFQTELFGDVTFSAVQTVEVIRDYIANNFQEKTKYAQMRWNYFDHMDHNNSKRVWEAIQSKPHLIQSKIPLDQFAREKAKDGIYAYLNVLVKVWRKFR